MDINESIYKLFHQYPFVSTDSRKIEPNSLFFALKGENFNGNKFANDALKKGAAYAIIDEEEYKISEKTILVEDVLITLQNISNIHRRKLGIPILAITGSNGKTTTKELVSKVLSQKYKVCFTQGNLNNHIGVPLTLLNMTTETQFGVVEMGANHQGEIEALCTIAEPDYGLITNIGKAHLEGFGSFEGVKKTKAELYNFIQKKRGAIFLNNDNPILTELSKEVKNKITYGIHEADFKGERVTSPPFVHIKAQFPKGILYLNSNLIGDFNFENVMAAACIGNYFGIDPLKIQCAIKDYNPQNIRSQLIIKGELKIIMDAYNANPTSMQASIKSFVSVMADNKYLILGDMLELGKYSEEEHIKIIKLIAKYSFKDVFLVGKIFQKSGKDTPCKTFLNTDQLCDFLSKNKIPQGNILIKGSRGIQLEKILDFL